MVKFILIKSPDEWATTKQACRDELVVYLCFFLSHIYFALLPCIEHCFTNIKFTLYIYIYIYIFVFCPFSCRCVSQVALVFQPVLHKEL